MLLRPSISTLKGTLCNLVKVKLRATYVIKGSTDSRVSSLYTRGVIDLRTMWRLIGSKHWVIHICKWNLMSQ